MVAQGALSAVAINQKDIGLLATDVAKEIIDGANPGETPVRFLDELQPVINFETADRLGIEVPEELASEVMDIKDRLGEE